MELVSCIEEGTLELRGGAVLEETDLVSRASDASLIFHEMDDWGRIELILGNRSAPFWRQEAVTAIPFCWSTGLS